jgi:hypothetical protein
MFRSIQQDGLKHDLHQELKLRYREFFESKLAVAIIGNTEQPASIQQLSAAILELINTNPQTILERIAAEPKILDELCEPYFGSCYHEGALKTPAEILATLTQVLNSDHLPVKADKTSLVSALFPPALFSKESRSRIPAQEQEIKATQQLGICRNPVFQKMVGLAKKSSLRAMERFKPDYQSSFFKASLEQNRPSVCGPSGHTGSLMLGAKLYGNFKAEALKEYALMCFAFLTAGGNHSFHEVMIIAALAGLSLKAGSYAQSIPGTVKELRFFTQLKKNFPEFLDGDAAPTQGSSLQLG